VQLNYLFLTVHNALLINEWVLMELKKSMPSGEWINQNQAGCRHDFQKTIFKYPVWLDTHEECILGE
jgi:hypothetical protein